MVKTTFLTALGFVLVGCGGGNSGNSTPAPTPFPNVSGNYSFTATSQVSSGKATVMGGSLSSDANGNVTGIVHVVFLANPFCFSPFMDVPITGTTSKAGQLTLTSASIAGQIIALNGTVGLDGSVLSNATYSITGGCANGDRGTATGSRVQSYSGVYTGSFKSNSGPTVALSGMITQSATADPHGSFDLSGTLAFTGSPCFTSAVVQSTNQPLTSSQVAGLLVTVNLAGNDGSAIQFIGVATDATTKSITGSYIISGGLCDGDNGQGTLSH